MNPPVHIEVPLPPERVPCGEPIHFRVNLTRPIEVAEPPLLTISGLTHPTAILNTDLLLQETALAPGDRLTVTVGAKFNSLGPSRLSAFELLFVGNDEERVRRFAIPFPDHPFRVVPALDHFLAVSVQRICGYDDAIKVEVVLRNCGGTELGNFEIEVDHPESVRAGPTRRRVPSLRPGEELRFDLVVTSEAINLNCTAILQGERVESRHLLAVPAESNAENNARRAFVFIEPRALTTDRVSVIAVGGAPSARSGKGVIRLAGGKARYIMTIFPSNLAATGVRLYPARGQVEVEPSGSKPGEWEFLLTIVENPTLTQLVRLDYDVQTTGLAQRGELYLSIQPTTWKHLSIAITAGFAVTLKGAAALIPMLVSEEVEWNRLWESLGENWFDLVQFLSIGLIYSGLMTVNYFWTSGVES